MGLGFVRQCKGELESSLDAYTKSLSLWENELGPINDPIIASVRYIVGAVLIEMQRLFDASDYFSMALHLFKCTPTPGPCNRADILSTEGMLFRVLGEDNRAIDCFQKAVLVYETASQSNTLKFATVMFELGSLLSQRGEYIDSANCFNIALEIRKHLLGDSFVVACTHYSLGVTIASQELKENTTLSSASHLEEALRICQQAFKGEHVQSAIIIQALGVLNEGRGDSLSASAWFAKEHTIRKMLFGEGKRAFALSRLYCLL
jgi:tetratricopeptide (TPR) repeat protein